MLSNGTEPMAPRRKRNRARVADKDRKRAKPKGPFWCYALAGSTRKTYVGFASESVERRLREHNTVPSKTKGTSTGGPWRIIAKVGGFHEYEHALMFEWRWQYEQSGRRRANKCGTSISGTMTALDRVLALPRWTKRAPAAANVKLTVERFVT